MALRRAVALPPEQRLGVSVAQCPESSVTELTSCVQFHLNNIGPLIIRREMFAHLGAHFVQNNNGGLLNRKQSGRGVKLTTHFYLMPMLYAELYPHSPIRLYGAMINCRDIFTLLDVYFYL
jgi:hypothetical protein